MEALAAVGLAANILQFVDCLRHVLDFGNQLHHNGTTEKNMDLEKSAKLLEHQLSRIKAQKGSTAASPEADMALDNLADECISIAKELMGFIDKFKIRKDLEPQIIQLPAVRALDHRELALESQLASIQNQLLKAQKFEDPTEEEETLKQKEGKQKEGQQRFDEKHAIFSELWKPVKAYQQQLREAKVKDEVCVELWQNEELVKRVARGTDNSTSGRNDQHAESDLLAKPIKEKLKRPSETKLMALTAQRVSLRRDLKNLTEILDNKHAKERDRIQRENERRIKNSDTRNKITTLRFALKLEWNKAQIEELTRKLDRMRSLLYSEVMLNIQKSVQDVVGSADHSEKALTEIISSQQAHTESMNGLHDSHLVIKSLIIDQGSHLLALGEAADIKHERILQAINSFTDALNGGRLWPAIPEFVTRIDPSLKSAALNGFDVIENAVLAALHFRMMDIREAQVHDAYQDTCSWIFEDPNEEERPWSNFRLWLEEQTGCYWIEGKAGCGKSTLMKFLRADIRTKTSLKKWAADDDLIIASYFFWRAGNSIQKNQEGLLRSLLHSILTQKPNHIARVFPKQYSVMMRKVFADNSKDGIFFSCEVPGCTKSFINPKQLRGHQKNHHKDRVDDTEDEIQEEGFFTVAELKKAFMTLAKQNLNGLKICLFIDGLDEYVGDQQDVADLFKNITSNCAAIKAVVSSRPEPVFVEAFHNSPQLRVEKLTAGDIDHYVRSHLMSHSKMRGHRGANFGTRLISSIASKASGVFLWVFLVVRSLVEHLSDGSYPEDLEQIIDTYPQELQELYEHMFARMKPSHRAEAFKLFRTIQIAQEVEETLPSALRLSFADRNQPSQSLESIETLKYEELHEFLLQFEDRLRSRCCGLFEVQYFDIDNSHIHHGRVTYLHRTVNDFLHDPSFLQVLEEETSNKASNIYEHLASSVLYSFKAWKFAHMKKRIDWKDFTKEVRAFLVYCQRCESLKSFKTPAYINALDEKLTQFWHIKKLETVSKADRKTFGDYEHHWAQAVMHALDPKLSMDMGGYALLSLTARFGLSRYVCEVIHGMSQSGALHSTGKSQSLLVQLSYYALHDSLRRTEYLVIITEMLAHGIWVNMKDSSHADALVESPWQELLSFQSPILQSHYTKSRNFDHKDTLFGVTEIDRFDIWCQLVELFVRNGAELDTPFKAFQAATRTHTARAVIVDIMAAVSVRLDTPAEASDSLRQSQNRMERFLAGKPISQPSRIESGYNSSLVKEKERPKSTPRWQSGMQIQPRATPAIHPPTDSSSSEKRALNAYASVAGQHCRRCETIESLREIGFELDEITKALDKAGVGHDLSALASWILAYQDKMRGTETTIGPVRSLKGNLHEPITTSTLLPNSSARQWSVVAKSDRAPKQEPQVVGAEYVFHCKKTKSKESRRGKGRTENSKSAVSSLNAGAIGVAGGTFTWFFEPHASSAPSVSLTADQVTKLETFLKSLI